MIPPGSPPDFTLYESIEKTIEVLRDTSLMKEVLTIRTVFADKKRTLKMGFLYTTIIYYKDESGTLTGEHYLADFILDYMGSMHFDTPEKELYTPTDNKIWVDKLISGDKSFVLASGFKVQIDKENAHHFYFDKPVK